jgi:hypothetical protein
MNEQKRRLPVKPILITIAATLFLSVGSFYGCSRTFMSPGKEHLNAIYIWSFAIFAVMCAVSVIWLLVVLAMNLYRRPRNK